MIALSSAYKKALVAVKIDSKSAFEELDSNCKHSENILLTIDSLLDKIGCQVNQNNVFAVVCGPGSFTGIRIGLALVKGLYAGNRNNKLISITTFELIAYSYIKNFKPKKNFAVVINALSGLYYICEFDAYGQKINCERLITKEEFEKLDLLTVGLEEESLCKVNIDPTAEELLELAIEQENKGIFTEINCLNPLYLRKSQAEDALEEKMKKVNKI